MVLIISSNFDVTTNLTAQWLNFYKTKYYRLNHEEFTHLNFIEISSGYNSVMLDGICVNDLNYIWHRRGRLNHASKKFDSSKLNFYLRKEEEALVKSLEFLSGQKTTYIGTYNKEIENHKLINLYLADKVGFKIPNTIVTTSRQILVKFYQENNKIIAKDLRYPIMNKIKIEDQILTSKGTVLVTSEIINKANEVFYPTLLQEYIEKEFEIRVFVFENQMFPMAIFSQADDKTKIDYRNYNKNKPNRCVPYSLPQRIKEKITKFMSLAHLNTGSVDLIFSTKSDYVFLEINPMGQLDWLSKNCNYYIEKTMAQYLSNYEKNK